MTFDSHLYSSNIYLDGVDFKFSDVFTSRKTVRLPDDFDLKDPEVLLDDLQYDFTLERKLAEDLRRQRLNEEKRNKHDKRERDRQRQELAEKHKQFLQDQEDQLKENQEDNSEDNEEEKPKPVKISPGNPFFNDMIGNTILTPQPVNPTKKTDTASPKTYNNLDINDFENDGLDPFSNMELRTLDDMKELKDVLQYVTLDINTNHTNTKPSISPNQIRHSPSFPNNNNNHIVTETEVKPPPPEKPETSNKKLFLLDELTDMLTTDCENKLSTDVKQSSQNHVQQETLSNIQFSSPEFSKKVDPPASERPRSSPVPENNNSLDTNPPGPSTMSQSHSVPTFSTKQASPITVLDNNSVSFKNNSHPSLPDIASETNDTTSRTPKNKSPEFELKFKKSPPKPKPKPKSKPKPSSKKETVLVKKSAHEKAKFEETIIKALTSLPQLPKPQPPQKAMVPEPIIKQRSSSLLEGLSSDEKDFVNGFVAMGFKETDIIRSMQKYGQDQKEVLNHLCAVQKLCEEGFETSNVEHVMEMFSGNEEEVKGYLTLQQQFLDMGFSCEKINQALLLNDKDQSKTLDALMAGT